MIEFRSPCLRYNAGFKQGIKDLGDPGAVHGLPQGKGDLLLGEPDFFIRDGLLR